MENGPLENSVRRVWNIPWNIRKSEHARPKPDGGFCFIPAMALMRAWWAYKREIIRLYDLRVWFACFELVARRCIVAPNRFPRYSFNEVHRLVGGRNSANVQTAVRRLTNAGLLDWSERRIRFPAVVVDVETACDSEWRRMVDLVVNNRRKVPVPRRTVRFLAGMCKPVSIATVIGHLLRCLYYRNGMCAPDGRCKASWIAETFGVDVRNVKAARQRLREIGWLVVEESGQTALNRWGAAVRVNLAWTNERESGDRGSPPPAPCGRRESPPPIENWKLSSRMKDQKSAPAVRPGGCHRTEKPATLTHVTPEDLKNPVRLEALFVQAQQRGWTPGGEAARLRFVAAAEHAGRVGRRNPPGLFASIVRRGLWAFISAADEDAARKRLVRSAAIGTSANPFPSPSRVTRTAGLNSVGSLVRQLLAQLHASGAALANPAT